MFIAGLVWCGWKLRDDLATQRLLVDQLPISAEIESIRRAVSRRQVRQAVLICLAVSLTFGIGAATSPSRPGSTGAGVLLVLPMEIGDERDLRQLPR